MEKLIVYGFEMCGDCQKAKAFMDEHNMIYENRDIRENEEYKKEFLAIGEKLKSEGFEGLIGVPCFVMGGETIMMAVYDEEEMKSVFKKYKALA